MKDGKPAPDESGDLAANLLAEAGHVVTRRKLIPDDGDEIRKQVKKFLGTKDDALLLTGGTGVAKSDVTIEAVRPFLEKELEGFGELFRRTSYDEIGAAAYLTRATAGVSAGKLILCLPGSPAAVRMALEIGMGEFPHLLYVARH